MNIKRYFKKWVRAPLSSPANTITSLGVDDLHEIIISKHSLTKDGGQFNHGPPRPVERIEGYLLLKEGRWIGFNYLCTGKNEAGQCRSVTSTDESVHLKMNLLDPILRKANAST